MERQTFSPDQLENELVELESTIARLRAAQVEILAEIDRMQVPLGDGCRTLAEWVAGRLDVAPETARRLVRLVHSAQATTTDAMVDGTVTFDRATELNRIPEDAHITVESTRRFDIPALRRLIAHHRRVTHVDHVEAFQGRHLVMQPSLDESHWRLWGSLPGYQGKIVDQTLTERADRFPPLPDGSRGSRTQRTADALVAICTDAATGGARNPLIPTVSVFVDAHSAGLAGASVESGPPVGGDTLEQALCCGAIEVTSITDGTPLGIGRKRAAIPPRLRRYVLWRDGGCAIDGCTSRYRIEAHHIVPYSQGGRTDADNLTAVCWFHHHVVIHGMGYQIDPDTPPQRRRFLKPGTGDPP